MLKKFLLTTTMFAIVAGGVLQLTAGACEDACAVTYQLESGRCYDYPATSWLRQVCLIAAQNKYNNCLATCN